jgi:thiosulfate/3-mercaptopyruvate sulfurtransferase
MNTLISTDQLAEHLDDPDWVIFDCRFDLAEPQAGERAYRDGHIPGARYAHLNRDLAGPTGPETGRHPLPDPELLAGKFAGWGVGHDSQIVAYDDRGGMFAARLWWLARWLGHGCVAVLDGGLTQWLAEERPLDRDVPRPKAREFKPRVTHDLRRTTADVEALVDGRRDARLVDARARARYLGEQEPVDPVAGHIPGAINLPFMENLDEASRFRAPKELVRRFHDALGDRDAREVIHSCGSGVTACHNLLAMEVAGLHGSTLYAGSFSEWISDPKHPVETGET